ncbi:hypothetical protein [Sphingobium olei]|uniref:Terminase n=1 Tax=Sphingobium olei TaxID=420955 RepID=A0ABW3P982_9SPHN
MGKSEGSVLVTQRQRAGGESRPQQRKRRSDGWSKADEALFLQMLAETCNASEAARAAGKCRAGAYRKRAADPAFARAWDEALDMGYAEIELMLMRAALFGSESEEVTSDGEGAVKARKVRRAPDLGVALRLFLAYRDRVAGIRAQRRVRGQAGKGAGGGDGRPDSAAAIAQVEAMMAEIARRRAAAGA